MRDRPARSTTASWARTSRVRRLAAVVATLGLALAGCTGPEPASPAPTPADPSLADPGPVDPEEPSGLLVVATTSILGDIVRVLVEDDGDVRVLMPPGVDPHGFQPSAADAALLREADLVVANGLGLEERLLDALEAALADGVHVFELAEHLDPIDFGEAAHDDDHGHDDDDHGHEDDDHGHDDDDHGHDHGPLDPHVWFDPVRMAEGVRLLAAELATVAGSDASVWEQRGQAYADELLTLHDEIAARYEAIPEARRVVVTNHEALGYLAHRYGLRVVGTVIPGGTTHAETDPRRFAELVETVERTGVRAIVAENVDSTRLAEQLAQELAARGGTPVEVVHVHTDALGQPGSGAEDYLGLLRSTAFTIADAL